jgi:hypothetical protein
MTGSGGGGLRPIHLVRYGLPAAILVAGIVVIAVGSGASTKVLGIVLVGVALLVFGVNVLARLTISSQVDRDREQQARERFTREGRWPR